jgi:hypothetical protein
VKRAEPQKIIDTSKVLAGIAIAVIILISTCTLPNVEAQAPITFTTAEQFGIPAYKGTISFAVNGSYSSATLENGFWVFTNLQLQGSQMLATLKFSAQNSNVTIQYYQSANAPLPNALMRYSVQGQGKQILNVGIGSQESGADWTVITASNVFLPQGKDWTITSNGTITVNGLTGNVTIAHFNFNSASTSNLPFYEQHSVAIAVAIALAVTVSVAVVIKVKSKPQLVAQLKGSG